MHGSGFYKENSPIGEPCKGEDRGVVALMQIGKFILSYLPKKALPPLREKLREYDDGIMALGNRQKRQNSTETGSSYISQASSI